MALGITISPLKKSARTQTRTTFKAEPKTMTTTTSRDYTLAAFFPNRYSALI